MWRIVLAVVLWNTVSAQPVTDDPQLRTARQADGVECCPCPGSSNAGQQLAAARAALDDCPCRLRDADADGAASDLLPRTLRPAQPVLMHEAPKDDVKPLLKPEVGLASSMLETLREVTDEEYQDALARDAARNAARVAELGDAAPDTAKNIVTIIINPRDDSPRDAIPEASQAFETRCAQPSEQARESGKTPVFKLQPNNLGINLMDMDSGASSIQENILGLNKALEGLRLKTTPAVLKLFPLKKQGGNIQSLLKLKDNKQTKTSEPTPKKMSSGLESKIPSLKLPSLFRLNEDRTPVKPLSLGLSKLNISKILTRKNSKNFDNTDSNPASSIIHEQFALKENKKTPTFDLKSILPNTDTTKIMFDLKNILNLKDVELIPPKTPKIELPGLNLFPPLRINKPKTTIENNRKSERLTNDCKAVNNDFDEEISDRKVHTEILDTIPHAAENNPVIAVNDIQSPNMVTDSIDIQKDENIKTNILDALPSASETNEMSMENENRKQIQSSFAEVANNFDDSFEPQHFQDDNTNKLLKDNVNFNDDNVETFINNNMNDQLDEFDMIQDNDQPVEPVNINDSELDGLDLEIDDESANIVPPLHTFSIDENNPVFIEEENHAPIGFEFEPVQDSEDFDSLEIAPAQIINDEEVNRNNVFRQLSLDVDGIAETTNQNMQIASIELTEEKNSLPSNNFEMEAPTEIFDEEFESASNTHSNTENNFKSSFDSQESLEADTVQADSEIFRSDEKSAEVTSDNESQLNMQDLQLMSDTLLRNSENSNPRTCTCGNLEEKNTRVRNLNTNEARQSESDPSFTQEDKKKERNNSNANNENLKELDNKTSRSNKGDSALGTTAINDNTCTSNFQKSNEPVSILSRSNDIEMASAASEPVFQTYPQKSSIVNPSSPLLHQSIVVQPSSLFPPIAPLDLSTIPTLDDIRSGISNLLGENARAAVNDEIDSTDDCDNLNPAMSSDASTTSTRSALAPFKPLEGINLDIFQINPLSQSPLSSKLPTLNLNSFKTKLALPKGLGLKPIKLQSSLGGKNGGLLGATLTFGPDKISSSQKFNPITKLGSILNHQGTDILGDSLSNIPTLEELRSKIRANTESLIKPSLANPLEDTLRTTEALGNSLKYHTENTMKNIQQTLSSTLNEARMSTAETKFARPENILEMVTSAHEDAKDKLHGIHVDLQDRLASLHNDILERTKLRIPMLQAPLFSRLGRLQEESSGISRSRSNSKKTPSPKLIINKKKPTAKVNKLNQQSKIKPFKMSKAASSLTPKTVTVPKLMVTSSKPPFLRPLQRDESLKLKEPSSIFVNDQRQSLGTKRLKPFGVQTKITISPPSQSPNFRSKSKINSQSEAKSVPNRGQQSALVAKQRLGMKSPSDLKGFASESKSIRVPARDESFSSTDFPRKNPSASSQGSLPEFSLGNPLKSRTSISTLRPTNLTSQKALNLPKPTESPLVSKVREAIRIRFSRPEKTGEKLKDGQGKSQAEGMTRSASENRGVAVRVEAMKENVPYKCKMVCVRD